MRNEEANELMLTQIKLSPYNPEKSLYLVVDGASKIGTGFCLLQSIITILRSGDQSDIVTTPTQPQLNSKVAFDTKITLDHHPPPPHKLNVINISAVADLILTIF